MSRKHIPKIVFKPYEQNQLQLLPPSLDELIPEGHLVRLVNDAIEQMNIDFLLKTYKGGGTSSYHPKMLLKVIIYAYTQRIYTVRRISKALRENIHFMWLAGGNRPDFRTINRFRSSRLKGQIDQIFMAIMEMLLEGGYVDLRDYFLDGTKIEANANKYSYVWKKSVKRYKAQLQQKLKALLSEIDQANEAEDRLYGDKDLAELGEQAHLSSKQIEQKIKELEQRLEHESEDKRLKKAVKQIKEDILPRQRKYESQEELLGDRNSYSKTDPDATFMRRKEDHLKNSALHAAYNIQLGTQNQFICGYSVHQNAGDSGLLIPHLTHIEGMYGYLPLRLIADSAYGSEENYEYLEDRGIQSYVKYNQYHKEQTRSFKANHFRVENLEYDKTKDRYKCPAGRYLYYSRSQERITQNGYKRRRLVYEAEDCSDCELRSLCNKGKGNRRIEVSHKLNRYRQRARELLDSEEGRRLRSRRSIEVESVFGQLKHNGQFRRFYLRGLEKVHLELGLHSIAHNLKKWHQKWLKRVENQALLSMKNIFKFLQYQFLIFHLKKQGFQLS